MTEKFDFSKIEDQKKAETLPKEERDRIEREAHRKANVMMKQVEFVKKKDYDEADKIEFPKDVSNEYAQITYNEEFEKLTDEEQKELREKERYEALEMNKEFDKPDSEIEVTEKELSAKVIEKIMNKVQDINLYGTAFTIVPYDRVNSVLENGVLGLDKKYKDSLPSGQHGVVQDQANKMSKDLWLKHAKNRQSQIWFTMVGKSFEESEKKFEKHLAEEMEIWKNDLSHERIKDNVIWERDISDDRKLIKSQWFKVINSYTAIIFDSSSFKESSEEEFFEEDKDKKIFG